MALVSKEISLVLSISLVVNAGSTILAIWLVFALFPTINKPEETLESEKPATADVPSRLTRFKSSLTSTLVIMPVLTVFYLYNLSSSILILIFISIMAMQPAFAKDFKAGKALIIGNLIGGIASILAFEILTVIPELFYLILLVLFAGLIFGRKLFSGKPLAPLFGMAYSTYLLILCSETSGNSDEVDSKVWTRVIQIMVAVVYVVVAFGLIERFKNTKNKSNHE